MLKLRKTYTNEQISELFNDVATAYEIKKKNRFRIISYQNAADNVLTYPKSVYEVWKKDPAKLDNIPGVGKAIIEKLDYLFSKHRLHPHLQKAFHRIHPMVFTFTKVNGIGPKTAYKLTKYLKFPHDPVKALDKLVEYAQSGRIGRLPRMGKLSEHQILENTLNFLGRKKRMTLAEAQTVANKVISYLHLKFPDIEFAPLGSLRRASPTVGDIDIAAKSDRRQEILEHFLSYPEIVQVINHGDKKASARLLHDIRLDLMVQPSASWGSLLVHFTGSRQHNILLRRYALSLGYSISEYGITEIKNKTLHLFPDEKSFYNFLHLKFIPPEGRLGENEINAAKINSAYQHEVL